MTKLQRVHTENGQSPRRDNLTLGYPRDGTLALMAGDGIRDVTDNRTRLQPLGDYADLVGVWPDSTTR